MSRFLLALAVAVTAACSSRTDVPVTYAQTHYYIGSDESSHYFRSVTSANVAEPSEPWPTPRASRDLASSGLREMPVTSNRALWQLPDYHHGERTAPEKE